MIYFYQVEMSHIIVNFSLKDFMLLFRICFLLTHHVPYSPFKISMWLFFLLDGITNAKLIRPDHLGDLLSVQTNQQKGQGAKPKRKQKPDLNENRSTRDNFKGRGENEVSKRNIER